jgi:hypothetical protein
MYHDLEEGAHPGRFEKIQNQFEVLSKHKREP